MAARGRRRDGRDRGRPLRHGLRALHPRAGGPRAGRAGAGRGAARAGITVSPRPMGTPVSSPPSWISPRSGSPGATATKRCPCWPGRASAPEPTLSPAMSDWIDERQASLMLRSGSSTPPWQASRRAAVRRLGAARTGPGARWPCAESEAADVLLDVPAGRHPTAVARRRPRPVPRRLDGAARPRGARPDPREAVEIGVRLGFVRTLASSAVRRSAAARAASRTARTGSWPGSAARRAARPRCSRRHRDSSATS